MIYSQGTDDKLGCREYGSSARAGEKGAGGGSGESSPGEEDREKEGARENPLSFMLGG